MGGSSANLGSRSEFLPGDGLHDPDIKYERYGGCFISTKKGVIFALGSLLLTTVVAYLVYRYAPRYNDSEFGPPEDLISNLLKTASKLDSKNDKFNPVLPTTIIPNYYRLRIQTFLDEIGPKNFSFEGHVAIVFQVTDSSTNLISLNVKNLSLSDSQISLSFSTTSKTELLLARSQVKEETTANTPANENDTITSSETNASDKVVPINDIVTKSRVAQSSEKPSSTEPVVYNTAQKTYLQILRKKCDDETFTIYLGDYLEENVNYTLEIGFSGKIVDGSAGFFRSKYVKGNETRWVASTIFKPFFARTVFPCFDEPNFKAKFEISVGRRTNMTALSNMPVKDTLPIENSPGWVWDHFEMTPAIPTLAVAFTVFNFNATKAASNPPVPVVTLWARNELPNQSGYLLDVAPKMISAYNNFYGLNHPATKIDLVAVPNYPVPAVGHWGLIFLRETMLATYTNSAKEYLNEVLSEELSSQWLGAMVTMESLNEFWFTDILNSYARYVGMQAAEPTSDIVTEVAVHDQQEVMDADSLNVLPNITTLVSGYNYFETNRILLRKGSSLIRILNATLTEPLFIQIVRNFVKKWQYKNTMIVKFWEEVELISKNSANVLEGIAPKDVFDLWVKQRGFPLLNVTRNTDGSVIIKQTRYTEDNFPNNDLWVILIEIITDSKMKGETRWLQNSSNIFEEQEANNESQISIMSPQMALCRMNYDMQNWEFLVVLLQTTPQSVSDVHRAQLIDDAFHLARTGVVPYGVPLNLSLYLLNETNFIPWRTALKNFEFLDVILSQTSSYGDFQEFLLHLLGPIYHKLLPNNSSDNGTVKLRKLIFSWACKLSHTPCTDWAYSRYLEFTNLTHPVDHYSEDNEYRSIVYCVGAQMRGKIAWNYFWNKYFMSNEKPRDANDILIGMGCLKESWILTNYLDEVLKDENLENSVLAWESLSSSYAVDVALDFIITEWSIILQKYHYSDYAINRILNAVLMKVGTKTDLDKVVKFFASEKSKLPNFARDFAFIVEKIKMRIDWKQKYLTTFTNSIKISNFY